MADQSIDRISVEISSDATAAVRNLKNLVSALGKLESKVNSSTAKLLQYSTALNLLKRAVTGINFSGLKQLNEVKFSATVPKNLTTLANTLKSMPADAAARLAGIATALTGLRITSIPKGSIDQFARLPQILATFQGFDTNAFGAQMRELNAQLAPLAANIDRLARAYSRLPRSMQTAGLAARSVAASNRYLQDSNTTLAASNNRVRASFGNVVTAMRNTIGRAAALAAAFYGLRRAFDATIGNVNTYIENMNLFQASMGEYANAAAEYGQQIQNVLGIDFADWARNQGVFQTLITGMGDTADRAAVMSQQLTQLGYDIASFYNISVEDAMLKLQSGMAGELEPLRRLGWDLSNARMQLEATKLGIQGSVQEMTQAEKVGLRYHLIMTQVTQTHGDMARTIASPANQLRVLQAQLSLAARAIGNLFIPALNMILPVVIAVVKAIRLLAQNIGGLFGIDANFEVDYSTLDTSGIATGGEEVDDLTESFEDSGVAADKAKKKIQQYKNTVMGFDELNKLNPTPEDNTDYDSGAGVGAGADAGAGDAGAGIDLPLETYDFLASLNDHISQMTDEMAEKILALLPLIAAVAGGFAAWKIASALGLDLLKCAGLAMAVAGAVILVWQWLDAWNNGINWQNLLGMLGGIALLVGGLTIAFGATGAAIGLVVGGVALLVVGIKDFISNGASIENMIAIFAGFGLLVAGLALAFGATGAAVGLLIGGVALLAAGFIDFLQNGPTPENTALVVAGIMAIGAALAFVVGWPALLVAAIVAAIAAIAMNWDWLCENVFAPIGEWLDQNVIQPIVGLFTGLGEFFSGLWDSISGTAEAMWHNIGVFADGCWQIVSKVWEIVSGWFDKNVIQPLTGVFSNAWNSITEWASSAWDGIQNIFSGVADFFGGIFSDAWRQITSVFQYGGQIFDGVVDAILDAFKNVVNQLISGLNWALAQPFNGLNSILALMRGWEILDFRPFAGFWDVPVPQIPYLAEGRYGINKGQLFVARERGAEMVGSMNGHTTVANNEQIVEGIEAGVISAMVKVMAMNTDSENQANIEIPVFIGSEQIAKATWRGEASLLRRGVLKPQFG